MRTTAARKIVMPETGEIRVTTDEKHQGELEKLVLLASRGDSRAIGVIAVSLGPKLLEEARDATTRGAAIRRRVPATASPSQAPRTAGESHCRARGKDIILAR